MFHYWIGSVILNNCLNILKYFKRQLTNTKITVVGFLYTYNIPLVSFCHQFYIMPASECQPPQNDICIYISCHTNFFKMTFSTGNDQNFVLIIRNLFSSSIHMLPANSTSFKACYLIEQIYIIKHLHWLLYMLMSCQSNYFTYLLTIHVFVLSLCSYINIRTH